LDKAQPIGNQNLVISGIISVINLHWITSFLKWFRKNNDFEEPLLMLYTTVKMPGSGENIDKY
jgi:hypothetical protein